MQINQMEDAMMQGMRPNVPRDAQTATTLNYDYPGKEELHRFYDSALAAGEHKNPLIILEKCVIPVGLLLTFGLFIGGMLLDMFFYIGWSVSMLGMMCGFATIILKGILIHKVNKLRTEHSNIDFAALNSYKFQYMKYGFTGGRRLSYCLMGDTMEHYEKEKKSFFSSMGVFFLVIGIFIVVFITYIATKNHPEIKDTVFEIVMGFCFFVIGIVLGLGTMIRPMIKSVLYGRKIKAVCVDVERYMTAGDSSADSLRPIYMAIVDGRDYIYFEEVKSNVQESSVGEVFPIYVSKKDPYQFACTQTSGNVLFGLIFLLSFGITGGVFLIMGLMNAGIFG